MLTLKAPLELKCNPAMIASHEAFYHRITGNYGLLSAGIDREDLLHVVTAPLELYLEEGRVTTLTDNTHIQNHQETKLEIINNVLNRITVMEEANLTYQDRVFITDVLKKLGVREVNRFMKQVFRLKQETRTTERLISLYWNHLGEFRERVEAWHSREKERKTVEERAEGGEAKRMLHQEIMNRLQTGAIYQIVNNFRQSHSGNSRYVTRQELQISEQKRVAVQVLLQKLRQEVRKEPLPLVYRHENAYRQSEPEADTPMEAWVSSQITSSVLLGLVDNLYLSLLERQRNRADIWLSMEHALYQSAENTLYRLKTESGAQWQVQSEQHLWSVRQQKLQEQEIYLAQALLDAGQEAKERFSLLWNQYGEHTWQLLREEYQSAEITYAEGADTAEEELLPAAEAKKVSREASDSASSPKSVERTADGKAASGKSPSALDREPEDPGSRNTAEETKEQVLKAVQNAERQSLQQERGAPAEGAEAEIHYLPGAPAASKEEVPEAQVSELVRWVREGREQFYRIAEQYLQVSRREYQEYNETFRTAEAAGQMERTIERLSGAAPLTEGGAAEKDRAEAAGTVLLKWRTGEQEPDFGEGHTGTPEAEVPGSTAAKTAGEALRQEALQKALSASQPQESAAALSMETVHRMEEQYDRVDLQKERPLPPDPSEKEASPELVRQLRQINRQNLERLKIYREIQKNAAPDPQKRPAAERNMRRDSLKALQDPEGFFREYEEERQRAAQEEQERTEKRKELLPEQTRRAYEKLLQHLSVHREGAGQEAEAAGSMGLLLRDIQEAEKIHKVTEQVPGAEEKRRIRETSETVLERWKEPPLTGEEPRRTFLQEQTKSELSLVHKSTEQQINQEMLKELIEQNRVTQGRQVITHEEGKDQSTVRRTVYQENRQLVNRETEDLTELIQKGVRQQMGVLSEQIYSRLERRLQNEKKRRGF